MRALIAQVPCAVVISYVARYLVTVYAREVVVVIVVVVIVVVVTAARYAGAPLGTTHLRSRPSQQQRQSQQQAIEATASIKSLKSLTAIKAIKATKTIKTHKHNTHRCIRAICTHDHTRERNRIFDHTQYTSHIAHV